MRVVPALILAVFCTIGFTVAGGLSSRIQLGSDDIGSSVLLDGANCSVMTNITSTISQLEYAALSSSSINDANNIVIRCDIAGGTPTTDCNIVFGGYFPESIERTAQCPFETSLCRNNSTNLALDTGFINTDTHLGVNAPPWERLLVRHKLHCAPLLTEGYSSIHGNSIRYHYGPQWGVTDHESFTEGYLNYTYEVENLESQYRSLDDGRGIEQSYTLRSVTPQRVSSERKLCLVSPQATMSQLFTIGVSDFSPVLCQLPSSYNQCTHRPLFAPTINGTPGADPGSSFVPNAELERKDADILLVFLSGHGVFFSEPLLDDWYRATERDGRIMRVDRLEEIPIYRTSEAASPLACASQWQFCSINTSTCGPLASRNDAISRAKDAFGVDSDGSSEIRSTAADRLEWLMDSTGIRRWGEGGILMNLQDSALLSKQSLIEGYQGHLPDNQWQLDVTNWFSIYLTFIQSNLRQTASGSQKISPGVDVAKPMTEAALSLCSNQKIRTTRYSSFSVFGILFTYILGALVLVTSYSLEPFLKCLHRRRQYRQHAYLEWVTNETLQLHRIAHERPTDADTTWSRCTSLVPTTAPSVCLPSLDIRDLEHPRLSSKHQINESSILDTSDDDSARPEAVRCGDSNLDPDCSDAEQPEVTHEAV